MNSPEDLIRVELAKKTAKSIVDHGSIPMATLKESIKLQDKVDELLSKEIEFPEVEPFPEIPEVDFTHLEEKINEILEETKKKDLLEYDLQIDEKTRKKLKGEKGDNYILTEKDKKEIASNVEVPIVEKVVETIIKEVKLDETPEEVVTKLESLKGNDRLSVKAIKGLDEIIQNVRETKIIGGGVRLLSSLLDVSISSPTNNQVLKYNSTTQKWENGASAGGAGGHTVQDEGTPLTARANLNFVGAGVTVTDGGAGPDSTIVTITSGGGSGDVVGPASATDNAIARYDLTTGKLIQNSGITIADGASGTLSGTNTGDQTSIVGITGTFAQFNTAVSDADLARTDAANTFTGIQTFSTPIATGSVATMTATVGGGVPTPPNNTTTFLRGDGTFATPAGSGDMVLASAQTNSGVKTFLDATLGLRNVANTITSFFTNTSTVARTYTLKDANGTIAFVSDITGTNSGTNTGDQTSIVGITGTKAQFDTAVTDGNFMYIGDAPTAHTHLLAAGATDVTVTATNLNILDDGLNTTLHFHDADRARGVHTGTQLSSTISDFTEASQDATGAMVDASLVYVDATPLLTRAALTGDITATQGSNATTLATVNANVGSFGLAASVSTFAVNAKGLITSASNTAIAIVASAVTDFSAAVRAVTLTGLSLVSTTVISATDTILVALGSLQAQITALTTTVGTKVASVTAGTNVTVTGTATAPIVNAPTMTATVAGAVPTPPNNTTTFLRGDGTFATPPGSSGVAGTLNVNTTGVGNVGIGEDDLITYSVAGGTLSTNGDYLSFEATGTLATSLNNKRIRVRFGSSIIFDSGSLAITTTADWTANGRIVRTAATTFSAYVEFNTSSATLSAYADYSTGTETLANALVLKFTGEATADNDVRQEFMITRVNSTTTDALIAYATKTTTISTTAPLSGGGDLSANRTLTTSMATNKLIGRGTAGTGVMEEITLGTNLSITGTTLNATGGSGGTITTQDEGVTLSSTVTTLNFTGAGVTASGAGATTTINIAGGSGSLTKGIAEVDFGVITQQSDIATVSVSDATVTTTSYPSSTLYAIATTDHDPDDYMVEGLSSYVTNVVNGVGFDIAVRAPFLTWGKYKVTYQF